MVEWRRARDAGPLAGLTAASRPAKRTPEQVENDRLRRENERLSRALSQTKTALQIVRKSHAPSETLSESADTDPRSRR